MSGEKFPYLCGGVLFVLLKQAAQSSPSSRERMNGTSDRHSDPKMMKDLIIALRTVDAVKDGGKGEKDPSAKVVSKYINCIENVPKALPFAKKPFASSYENLVKTQYSEAIEKMQKFIHVHLDLNLSEWLVKAILDVIDSDTDISDADQFFISPDGMPKSKAEIRHMNQFYLPAVLVGVMNYILQNRGKNNIDGATTLEKWGTKEGCCEREYEIDCHICFDRKIEVLFECPQTTDMCNQKTETFDEGPIDEAPIITECTSKEIYDRIVLLEAKITEFIQSI